MPKMVPLTSRAPTLSSWQGALVVWHRRDSLNWLYYPSWTNPLVIAIMTILAVQTVMAIMTLLAIKINIQGYRDHTGYQNCHSSFRNSPGYQLQETRSRVTFEPSSTLVSLTRRLPRLPLVICILVLFLRTLIGKMAFFSIVEVFDIRDIFFFLLGSNIDTCCRRVLALSPSPSITVLRTSLIVLVLFCVVRESVLSGRWLFLIKCVSRGGVGGFILSRVFFLFFCALVLSRASWIYLADARRWLEHCFCLFIDGFFNNLFSRV